MQNFQCQHCGIKGGLDIFVNSTSICKQCLRNRPICWKVVLYSLANIVDDSTGIPTELKEPPQTRGKACCKLQNMSMPASKQLINIMKFDELYKVWYAKKCECQDAKGGGGAYADQCREALFKYLESKKKSGELYVRSLEKFINYTPECKNDIYWKSEPFCDINDSAHVSAHDSAHDSSDNDISQEGTNGFESQVQSYAVSETGGNDETPNVIEIIARNSHRKKKSKKQNLEIQKMQKMIDELKTREMLYINIINKMAGNIN